MNARVTIDGAKLTSMVDRVGAAGAAATAAFLEREQKANVQSGRLESAITSEHGRDTRGWYARAGMIGVTSRHPAFFWYFHEYRTGRGAPGRPFLRPSLWDNTREVTRTMTGR